MRRGVCNGYGRNTASPCRPGRWENSSTWLSPSGRGGVTTTGRMPKAHRDYAEWTPEQLVRPVGREFHEAQARSRHTASWPAVASTILDKIEGSRRCASNRGEREFGGQAGARPGRCTGCGGSGTRKPDSGCNAASCYGQRRKGPGHFRVEDGGSVPGEIHDHGAVRQGALRHHDGAPLGSTDELLALVLGDLAQLGLEFVNLFLSRHRFVLELGAHHTSNC